MTSTGAARSLALSACFTAAAMSSATSIVNGDPPRLRVVFGAFGAAIALTALAGPIPGVVAAFSGVVIVTSLLVGFDPATGGLGRIVANLTT